MEMHSDANCNFTKNPENVYQTIKGCSASFGCRNREIRWKSNSMERFDFSDKDTSFTSLRSIDDVIHRSLNSRYMKDVLTFQYALC